jgi:hypothetical protein
MNSQSDRDFRESPFLSDLWEARAETILEPAHLNGKAEVYPYLDKYRVDN